MSRSYKKNPIFKDGRSGRVGKRLANKKVRRQKEEIPKGNSYKKVFCSYDIHDYIFRETYAEYKKRYESDLKAYLNGGLRFDPRDDRTTGWYSISSWEKSHKRK